MPPLILFLEACGQLGLPADLDGTTCHLLIGRVIIHPNHLASHIFNGTPPEVFR